MDAQNPIQSQPTTAKKPRLALAKPASCTRKVDLNLDTGGWGVDFRTRDKDHLSHLGLETSQDLAALFGRIDVVCMMGSPDRAQAFATKLEREYWQKNKGSNEGQFQTPAPFGKTERCMMFCVCGGRVLSLSHGMGNPSAMIFLHEVAKLLYHSFKPAFVVQQGKIDEEALAERLGRVRVIRMGTSGGLGCEAGSVVLTERAVDAVFPNRTNTDSEDTNDGHGFLHVSLGVPKRYPSDSDLTLNVEINDAWEAHREMIDDDDDDFPLLPGLTMGTEDYYEGQGRLDGALASWYSEDDKLTYLKKAAATGVRNIEMESLGFLAFWQRLGMRATVICAALLDRLEGDQHEFRDGEIAKFSARTQVVICVYLRSLGIL